MDTCLDSNILSVGEKDYWSPCDSQNICWEHSTPECSNMRKRNLTQDDVLLNFLKSIHVTMYLLREKPKTFSLEEFHQHVLRIYCNEFQFEICENKFFSHGKCPFFSCLFVPHCFLHLSLKKKKRRQVFKTGRNASSPLKHYLCMQIPTTITVIMIIGN